MSTKLTFKKLTKVLTEAKDGINKVLPLLGDVFSNIGTSVKETFATGKKDEKRKYRVVVIKTTFNEYALEIEAMSEEDVEKIVNEKINDKSIFINKSNDSVQIKIEEIAELEGKEESKN